MNELELLGQRRRLVVLSAEIQRATIAARLDRIEAHPLQAALGSAFRFWQRPWARQAAIVALGFALKRFHRKAH